MKWDQQDPKESHGGGEKNSVLSRLGLNPVNYPGKDDETLEGTDMRFDKDLECRCGPGEHWVWGNPYSDTQDAVEKATSLHTLVREFPSPTPNMLL